MNNAYAKTWLHLSKSVLEFDLTNAIQLPSLSVMRYTGWAYVSFDIRLYSLVFMQIRLLFG